MALVKKMMIQGIRSFSPDYDGGQVIEFFSPLTLIIGANGCGKTTIIESMKYAITGFLPPNTKNGGFINDPKLGSGMETRAMVKIEMLDKKGDKLVITRKLKATTKGTIGNVSTAKVEHTVVHYVTKSDGTVKKLELSSKCVDIEEMISRVIGVSEPILNNVIFCHQEESCWPLDEASKVKTKFDAIFNTTVYIKALKTLQDQEKAMATDIKLKKRDLEYSTESLQEARKKKARLDEEKVILNSMNDEITEHEKKIREVSAKIDSLQKLSQNYADTQSKVSKKKGEIGQLEKSIGEIRARIRELYKGDSETLQQKIDSFQFTYQQQNQALANTKQEKAQADEKRRRLDEKNRKFTVKKGIFDKEKQSNDRKEEEMGRIMEDLRTYLRDLKESSQSQGEKFSGSLDSVLMSLDVDLESVNANTAVKALDSAISSKLAQHQKLKTKIESEESKLQNERHSLGRSEQDIMTQVKGKQNTETQLKKKISDVRDRLSALDQSNDKLVELDDKEQNIKETIERLEKSDLNKNMELEVQNLQKDISDLEGKRTALLEQNQLLTADSTCVARLKSAQEQRIKKEKECNTILRRIEPQLRSLVDVSQETIPEENLNLFLQEKVDKLNKEVDSKTKEVNRIKMENVKAETQKAQVSKELEKKQREIAQITQKSNTVLKGASFVEEYANIFRETEEAQTEVSLNEAASCLYKQYVQRMTKKPCCPLCKRDFAKEAENKALMENLTKMMKKMEVTKPEEEAKLEALKAKQEQLVKLKPNWDLKEKLEKVEVPELLQKKGVLDSQIEGFKETLSELADTVSVLSIDKSSATSLLKDTALYDRSVLDKKAQDAEIRKWDAARDPRAKELTVTLNDVQTQMQNIESTVSARRKEKERKEKLMQENIAKLTKAKGDLNKIVKEKLDITGDLQNQDMMEKQKRELEAESVGVRTSIQDLNKQLPGIRSEVMRIDKELKDFKARAELQLSEVLREKESLGGQKERVSQLDKEIREFKSEKSKFEVEVEAHKPIALEIESCDEKIKELVIEIEILDGEVRSQQEKKRDLEENKILKTKEKERETLMAEIAIDSKTIEHAKIRGLQTQLNEETAKMKKITERKDQSVGSLRKVRENISALEEELRETKYARAENNYRTNLIKSTVLERAQKDIRLYRVALDAGVMTFHRKKMELINKYMRIYWRKVYRGNDIEYIAIKTDNEDSTGSGQKAVKLDMSKIQRKSYNYRVVAYRRGIELDMRGRCSAGQKILASIIIRLSLAQTFTEHCGIITLDEPTTNLDRQNVESLAETLCELAMSMSGHKTFQLVVITHDQEFIDTLLRIDPIQYYFKVKRDQMGTSVIERIQK